MGSHHGLTQHRQPDLLSLCSVRGAIKLSQGCETHDTIFWQNIVAERTESWHLT